MNADCVNTVGSYSCKCRAGYTGDGQTCNGKRQTNKQTNKQNLSSNTFDVDAECTEQSHFIFNNYEIFPALMGLKKLSSTALVRWE